MTDQDAAKEVLRILDEACQAWARALYDALERMLPIVKRVSRALYREGFPASMYPGQWHDPVTDTWHPWPPPALEK